MAEENKEQKKSSAHKAAELAKSTVTAAKGAGKIASGNVAGGVKDIASDKGLRNIILGGVALVTALCVMMISSVPGTLFMPSEAAYADEENTAITIAEKVALNITNPIAALVQAIMEGKDAITNILSEDDENSAYYLQVIADEETTNGDKASKASDVTMRKMLDITEEYYTKRHEKVLEEINDDYEKKKGDNVTKTIKDPITSGSTTTDLEAVKLMCLYTVQTDGNIRNIDMDDYISWLGEEDTSWFSHKTKMNEIQGQETLWGDWDVVPKKWNGTMLAQSEMDEINAKRDELGYNKNDLKADFEDNYGDKSTSALQELCSIDPEIERTVEDRYNEKGEKIGETVRYTYTIKTKSINEICTDIVKFDEAVEEDENGNVKASSMSAYRKENYEDMIKNTCDYFGISYSGSNGYSSGGNSDIVRVALEEVGTCEISPNYVKYNDWFYGYTGAGGSDKPWCAVFVSWCANECGFVESGIVPKTAGCSEMQSFFETKGRIYSIFDTSFTPQPGDFIIRSGGAHIGIVKEYTDGILYTIEGNSGSGISDVDNNGGCVAEHAYGTGAPATRSILAAWGSGAVYCRPEYPSMQGASLSGAIDIPYNEYKNTKMHTITDWDHFYWTDGCGPEQISSYFGATVTGKHTSSTKFTLGGDVTASNGLVKFGGYYGVAMTSTFGSPGQVNLIVLESGGIIPVILIDEKSQQEFDNGYTSDHNPANKWGHVQSGCLSVCEFEVLRSYGTGAGVSNASKLNPAFDSNVVQVACLGSIYDHTDWINNIDKALRDTGYESYASNVIR